MSEFDEQQAEARLEATKWEAIAETWRRVEQNAATQRAAAEDVARSWQKRYEEVAPDQAFVHLMEGVDLGNGEVELTSIISLCCKVALPAGRGAIDPAAVTCPEYKSGGHDD